MSNNIILNKDLSNLLNSKLLKKEIEEYEFFQSVISNNTNQINKFLENDLNINIRDEKGRNALFWAIHNKNFPLIRKLISLNINTNVRDNLSAINYAVYKNDVKLIKCLTSCGVDINEFDNVDSTPLIYAVLYNKIQSIDFLVKNGACIIHEDMLGNSALSLAYNLKIKYLIEKFEDIIKYAD